MKLPSAQSCSAKGPELQGTPPSREQSQLSEAELASASATVFAQHVQVVYLVLRGQHCVLLHDQIAGKNLLLARKTFELFIERRARETNLHNQRSGEYPDSAENGYRLLVERLESGSFLSSNASDCTVIPRMTFHSSWTFPHFRIRLPRNAPIITFIRMIHRGPLAIVAYTLVSFLGLLAAFTTKIDWSLGASSGSDFGALSLVYLCIAVRVVCHELGHAIACYQFGGQIRWWGIGLYWGFPVAFCETSDSWTFQKWQRCVVNIGGVMAESILTFTCMLLITFTHDYPRISFMLLFTIVMSTRSVIFNLNPLLKMDGYWLLTDLVESPNLRKHSFRHIKQQLMQQLGGSSIMKEASVLDTNRHRMIYMLYGILAVLFTILAVLVGIQHLRLLLGDEARASNVTIWILAALYFSRFGVIAYQSIRESLKNRRLSRVQR